LFEGALTGSRDFVYERATEYERIVMTEMEHALRGKHRFTEWKVRCIELRAGYATCANPEWHVDSSLEVGYRPEHHVLFVTPPTTEFISPLHRWPVAVPAYTIVSYGRDLHRGPRALASGPLRLMIRASETDVAPPRRESVSR